MSDELYEINKDGKSSAPEGGFDFGEMSDLDIATSGVGAAMDIATGLQMYNPNKGALSLSSTPDDIMQAGSDRGATIGKGVGTGVGLALTPFLGPLGPIVGGAAGELLGGLVGGARAKNEARQLGDAQSGNKLKDKEYLNDMRMSSVFNAIGDDF